MLESLGTTSIGNLNLTEPGLNEKPYFNPEKNITSQTWEMIEEWMNGIYPSNSEKLDHAWFINLMSPGRVSSFDKDRADMDSDWIYGIYSENMGRRVEFQLSLAINERTRPDMKKNYIQVAMKSLAPLTTLFPEKKQKMRELLTKELTDIALEDLRDNDNHFEVKDFLNYAVVLPELALPFIRSNKELRDGLLAAVLEETEDYKYSYNDQYYGESFPLMAAALRLLLPDAKLEIYQETNLLMQKGLEYYREVKDWSTFIQVAWAMQVLSAERAELLENGTIKITPKTEPFTQEIPALPEMRKF
ncbi:MAG: hypothetical protein Q7R49_01775 [Candidatus Daviesbacteria bacterium]|nr:hypothetical protein [Candidatus Daviesbacteria bacterium]